MGENIVGSRVQRGLETRSRMERLLSPPTVMHSSNGGKYDKRLSSKISDFSLFSPLLSAWNFRWITNRRCSSSLSTERFVKGFIELRWLAQLISMFYIFSPCFIPKVSRFLELVSRWGMHSIVWTFRLKICMFCVIFMWLALDEYVASTFSLGKKQHSYTKDLEILVTANAVSLRAQKSCRMRDVTERRLGKRDLSEDAAHRCGGRGLSLRKW